MLLNHVILKGQIKCSVDCVYLEPLQFFMFWFFYKSGMFYKPKTSRQIMILGGAKVAVAMVCFLFARSCSQMLTAIARR